MLKVCKYCILQTNVFQLLKGSNLAELISCNIYVFLADIYNIYGFLAGICFLLLHVFRREDLLCVWILFTIFPIFSSFLKCFSYFALKDMIMIFNIIFKCLLYFQLFGTQQLLCLCLHIIKNNLALYVKY